MQCGAETEKRSAICNKNRKKRCRCAGALGATPKNRKKNWCALCAAPKVKSAWICAYLCPSAACLAKARKAKRLEHAFGVPVPDEVFERLTEEMACAEQAVKEAMPRGE